MPREETYIVVFPFTDKDAAFEFLRERNDEGWHGVVLDSDGEEVEPP